MRNRGEFHSADTVDGWRSHYRSMLRWQRRAEAVSSGEENSGGDAINGVDFALAFFVWAHSLREWLINDGVVDKNILDNALRNKEAWNMCRDLANRSRHFDLKRNPKDKYWSITRSSDGFMNQIRGTQTYRWVIRHDGQRKEVFGVIQDIRGMWDDVLIEIGLGNWVKTDGAST